MKQFLLGCMLFCAIISLVMAALPEQQSAPLFTAQASLAGKSFEYSLQEALKKGAVVVYFYPSAFTGGCNIEAHEFAINHDKFSAAGASIIGVSLDSIARLNDFSADPNYCAGKIAVASDVDGKIAKSYAISVREAVAGKKDTRGVEINHRFAERTTFIVTADGKIAATLSALAPADNVSRALEIVQKLDDEKKVDSW